MSCEQLHAEEARPGLRPGRAYQPGHQRLCPGTLGARPARGVKGETP
jgi:hypothetical protein